MNTLCLRKWVFLSGFHLHSIGRISVHVCILRVSVYVREERERDFSLAK